MMESRSENPDEQKQQLQTAMKAVGLAIQLDTSGSVPDAYLHYLSCMQYISQALLQDARLKVSQAATVNLKTTESMKMVKLAQRCSERVVDILNNMDEASTPTNMPVLPTQQTTTYSPSPPPSLMSSSALSSSLSSSVPAGRISPSMFPAVPSTLSNAAPTHVAVVRPTVQQPTHQRTTVPNASPSQQSNEALGPLEKAYRENRKLMAAYRSRLNKMHTTSKNKSLVNLTFQRRLMENMAIAKAREASLAKKIKERQQRLQEQAAQRFSSSGQPTKEEMELRTVYANILEYENVKTWLQEWRKRLQESPGDLGLIRDLLIDILSCDQHPLSQLLKRYQITIYHKIMPLIQKELPSIEEIVVPYRDVQPLKLQEPRAVPEDGFTTPDALDQSMEDTLAQRLHALRENSTSSVESDSTEPRPSSQASSMLFALSDVSDDIMEELMSDDEEEVDALEKLSIREKNIHRQHGGCHQRTAGEKDVGDDDEEGCEENGHLDDSGIQNGDESSSTDEAAPSTNIQDEDLESTSDGANVAGDAAPEVDQMREITDEIRNDIEQALEDGERLCKELEGETAGKVEDDEDGISNAVAMTTGDSMTDKDRENTGDGRTSAAAAGEQHSKYDNREGINGHSHPDTDERTKVESGDERTINSEGNRPDMQPSNNPSTQLDSSRGGVASDGESTDAGRTVGERESDEGKGKEDREERIAEMRSQALSRHLKCITKDVLMFTERLQSLLVAVYEQLNSTAAKEQCISVIEDFLFKDIWQPLLMLFRRYNYKKEGCAAIAMTMYQHALPQHIGVAEKFCLLQEGAVQEGSQALSSDYPYRAAVEELQKLKGNTCPLQKIECIVRVSRIVIECVEDYYESQGKPRQSPETTVGCDDLLPILSYVIMRSSLPQIVSECNAMEEFIHEGYLFGEEGYCLTTCQTALSYVLKLGSAEELSKS
nr:VPS9 domain-containing protein 1-like [Lytechinus pictus]